MNIEKLEKECEKLFKEKDYVGVILKIGNCQNIISLEDMPINLHLYMMKSFYLVDDKFSEDKWDKLTDILYFLIDNFDYDDLDTFYYHLAWAESFSYFEDNLLALYHYKRATMLFIDDNDYNISLKEIMTKIEKIEDEITCPHFSKSFRENVKDFFESLNANKQDLHKQIRTLFEKEKYDDVMDLMGEKLVKIFSNPLFHINLNKDNLVTLCFEHDIEAHKFYKYLSLKKWETSYKDLNKYFSFEIGLKENMPKTVTTDFCTINIKDLYVKIERDETSPLFNLCIYVSNVQYHDTEYEDVYTDLQRLVVQLVKYVLGENLFAFTINKIFLSEDELDEDDAFPLNKLRSVLEELGVDTKNITPKYCMYRFYKDYRNRKETLDQDIKRGDIIQGHTVYADLISGFFDKVNLELKNLHIDNVTAGFISFDREILDDSEQLAKLEEIEREIFNNFEDPFTIFPIGKSVGIKYCYIDFLIYDFDIFINSIKDVLEAINIQNVYYQTFTQHAKEIKLK